MNYDGAIDLVIVYPQNITVFFNKMVLKDEVDFCVEKYKTVYFDFDSNYAITRIPET